MFGRDLLRINTSLKIERDFPKEYTSAVYGYHTILILRQLLSTPSLDGQRLQ